MSEFQVDHYPTKVTVYPDRARVTSAAEIDLDPDVGVLIFDDLPLTMDTESVRFTGTGAARVRILSVDVTRKQYAETPSVSFQELEKQKDAVTGELLALQDELAVWQSEAEYLDGLRQATEAYAEGLARGKTTVAEQAQLADHLQARDRAVRAAQRDLLPQVEKLQRQLDKVERELADLRSQSPRQRYQARVEIETLDGGEFHPRIIYVTSRASWRPLYDIRLTETAQGGHEVDVSILADVRQGTGQDWNNVVLTVSTARPALNQRLPKLEPWYVDVYEPPTARPLMAYSADMKQSEMLLDAAMPAPARPPASARKHAEFVQAEIQDAGATVTYVVAGMATVESDDASHKNLLAHFAAATEITYLAVPRHTAAVYRRAKFRNLSAAPLLAGRANLFVDDEYSGPTELEYTAQGDEIELLMGVEERITVERELTRRQVDKRFLRENRVLHYAYAIELQNLLAKVAELEVQDQIPVARHEAIKVKLDQIKPDPQEQTDLHIMTWKLLLEPNEKQTIRYEFTVEHPQSEAVIGLQD